MAAMMMTVTTFAITQDVGGRVIDQNAPASATCCSVAFRTCAWIVAAISGQSASECSFIWRNDATFRFRMTSKRQNFLERY